MVKRIKIFTKRVFQDNGYFNEKYHIISKKQRGDYFLYEICLTENVRNNYTIRGNNYRRSCENLYLDISENLDISLFFNEIYEEYKNIIDETKNIRAYSWVINKSLPFLSKYGESINILDLGCGLGVGSWQIFKSFKDMLPFQQISLDISEKMLSKKNGEYYSKIQADGSFLPFRANSFDGIYVVYLFHYVLNIKKILLEIQRVLKHSGVLGLVIYRHDPRKRLFLKILKEVGLYTAAISRKIIGTAGETRLLMQKL